MHTIKLNVQDDIYTHIMFLLRSLDKKKLEILEDKTIADEEEVIDFSKYQIDSLKESKDFINISQKPLEKVWDNEEDSVYDKFL